MLNTAHIRRAYESRQSVGVSYGDYLQVYVHVQSLSSEWPCHRPRGRRALGAPCGLRRRADASRSHREGQQVESRPHPLALGLSLLLRLELLAEDGRDLALHEGPRHRRVGQRALLPARAIHLQPTTHQVIPPRNTRKAAASAI